MLRFFLSIIRTWWHSCTFSSSSAGLGFSFSFFACVFTSKLHVHEWMQIWIDDACVEQVPCMHELLYIYIYIQPFLGGSIKPPYYCREGHRTNCMHAWSISRKFLCMHCRQTSCIRAFFPHHACSTVAGLDQKPAGLLSIYTSWPHVHEWHPASYMHAMRASWVPHVLQALHFFSFFFFLRLHHGISKFCIFQPCNFAWQTHMHKANIYISTNFGFSSSSESSSDLTSSCSLLGFFSFFALSFSARSFAFFSFSSAVSGAFQALSESYIFNRKIIQDNVHGES